MKTTLRAMLSTVLLACVPAARAHLAPIDPSTCALDVALRAPDAGVTATVDPPAADLLRFRYEPDTSPTRSSVQACAANSSAVCLGTPAPRAFVVNGVAGTIALPAVFTLRMLSSGDLDAPSVPVVITLGGATVSVPFALTTGFALVGATPILGAPSDASGAVRLVGSGSSATLPAPLGGTPLALELACVHAPAPDLDQFAPAPRLTKIRGAITAKKVKITMTLESELSMTVDPAGVPTILRLQDGGGSALLERVVPLQSGPRGRFASSGGELKISPGKGRGVRTQKIVLKESPGPTAALASGSGTMSIETGGLMARRSLKLTANGKGSRLAVREQ
jgi:hypothetical protein